MARRAGFVLRFSVIATNKPINPILFHVSFSFSPVPTPQFEQTEQREILQNYSNTISGKDHERCEQMDKLQFLLQQGSTEAAYSFTKSIVLSKSLFSTPSDLLSCFSSFFPSLRFKLSNMLFSVCCGSKMLDQATELYDLMKRDGKLPPLAYLNVLLNSLVVSKQFDKVLVLFTELLESGFRPDTAMYGKAVQAAMMGDVKRGMELLDSMTKRGVRTNVFVYNVLIGGLCMEKRIRDAQELFDEMRRRNLVGSTVTYNSLIDGYRKVGRWTQHLK